MDGADVVFVEGELYVGIYQCDALELLQDALEFRSVGLEEPAAGGDVEEQVVYRKLRPAGTRHRNGFHDLRTVEDEAHAYLVVLGAGSQGDLSHRGDRCESLTPEAHRVEIEEVGGILDLGCSVTLEGHTRIGLRHTLAVVDDAYGGLAGIGDTQFDNIGSGIHRVLQQFLDY